MQCEPEIDQQVPADDEVKLREWRVRCHVLFGEDAHPPNWLAYLD